MYGEGSNWLLAIGESNWSGRGLRQWHGEVTVVIGTRGDPYGSFLVEESELKQVLTTTRERRSTIRKSEQFIVEVSYGNA